MAANLSIIGIEQTDITYMIDFMALETQPVGQRSQQLGVDDVNFIQPR